MNISGILIRILMITICIVLIGILLTDGDITKLTLFIQIVTLPLLLLALYRLMRKR